MNSEPPSTAKLELIREFLKLTGIQGKIDEGGFFGAHCRPGGLVFSAIPEGTRHRDAFKVARHAVMQAYEPHRPVWQEEYETHINWEFNSDELEEIVTFLGSRAGKHYQEGLWRMNAYISTNTEELAGKIIEDAKLIASSQE